MAVVTPLKLGSDGNIAQLQAGDTLAVASTNTDLVALTNGEATSVVIGAPAYVSAAGTFKKAQATSATLSKCIGLVYDAPSITNAVSGNICTDGLLTATTVQWDAVTGQSGGLTAGSDYFLGATLGLITVTPLVTAGQYNVKVGKALSTTQMDVAVRDPILL
jgi:hypothetical protein